MPGIWYGNGYNAPMDSMNLKLMSAMIAGGMVRDHGATAEVIAARSIRIALQIDEQVDTIGASPDGQPEPPKTVVNEDEELTAA